jgi:hypothetical protein
VWNHWHWAGRHLATPRSTPSDAVLGFRVYYGETLSGSIPLGDGPHQRVRGQRLEIWAPLWAFPLLFSVPPGGRLVSRLIGWLRGGRRARSYRCVSCGYDLRATPEKCPECGSSQTKVLI